MIIQLKEEFHGVIFLLGKKKTVHLFVIKIFSERCLNKAYCFFYKFFQHVMQNFDSTELLILIIYFYLVREKVTWGAQLSPL